MKNVYFCSTVPMNLQNDREAAVL